MSEESELLWHEKSKLDGDMLPVEEAHQEGGERYLALFQKEGELCAVCFLIFSQDVKRYGSVKHAIEMIYKRHGSFIIRGRGELYQDLCEEYAIDKQMPKRLKEKLERQLSLESL